MAPTLSPTPLSPLGSEQNLVASARAGDDRAFSELYARYQDRIRGFILAKVHDHGRAEDIAQEVFISALRRLRSSEQTIAFKPWIYEIAKNACIDEYRRNRRTSEVSLDADGELASGRQALMAIAPTPAAVVESRLKLDDLQGAFGGLSENHHRLLVMREFEGRSYTEIAASTGMSLPMVESALFRARRKLSEEYDEIASGRRCEQVLVAIETGRMQVLRSMGIRERRQLTRHLAHCQPCRREARLAGVDESLVKPRSIAARIAALLPFPLWRWPGRGGAGGAGAGGAGAGGAGAGAPGRGAGGTPSGRGLGAHTGGHHLGVAQSVQSVAAAAGPTGSSVTLGQAAAAFAALAIAGAGGGAATGLWGSGHPAKPAGVIRLATNPSPDPAATRQRALIGLASTAAARAHTSPGAARRPGHGRSASHTTKLRHFSRHPTPAPKATGSKLPSTQAGPTKSPGTIARTNPTRTGGRIATTRPTSPAKKVTGAVKKATGTVSGAPSKVVRKVTGVTGAAVSTVGRVVHGTGSIVQGTGSIVRGTGTAVQGTVGQVVQGTGRVVQGATGSVAPPSGIPVPPPVPTTTKTVTRTVARTVSDLLP